MLLIQTSFSYFHLKVPQSHRISIVYDYVLLFIFLHPFLRLHPFAHILVSSFRVPQHLLHREKCYNTLPKAYTTWILLSFGNNSLADNYSAQNEKQQKQKSADRQSVAFNVKAYARPLDLFQKSMTMLLLLCEISYSFGLS